MTGLIDSIQNQRIENKAKIAFILSLLCLSISMIVVTFNINRHYAGILNWFLFLPLSFLALYNSILFFSGFLKNRKGIRLIYLAMALPPIVYYIYFTIKIIISIS